MAKFTCYCGLFNSAKKSFASDNGPMMDRQCTGDEPTFSGKLFVSIFLLLLFGVGNVWGTDVTIGRSDFSNSSGTISATKNNVTVSCVGNIPSNKSYVTFTEGNTLTISTTTGNITAIDFTCSEDDYTGNLSDVSGISTTSWSLSVDNPGAKTTVRVTSIVVTLSTGSTYSITYADAGGIGTNGSYSASSTSGISSGATITLTATPADCYQLDEWSVYKTGDASTTVTVSNNQFTMPAYGVTVGASFEAKAEGKTVNFDAGPGVSASSSLTETCDGSGVTLPAVTASGVCKGWTTFAGWATSAVSDSTTTSVTFYSVGSKYTPASDNMSLYAVYSKVKSSTPVSVSGGDMPNGVGSTGWTVTGAGSYSGNGVKFDDANDYIQSPDLSSNSYKALTVKLKAGHNGGKGSVLTIASFDGSGNVIDSETFTPSDAYDSQSTLKTIDLSGSTVIKYIRVTMTSKTKNLGMKYCEVFTPATTTYYCSDPNCCTSLAHINGSFWRACLWGHGEIATI